MLAVWSGVVTLPFFLIAAAFAGIGVGLLRRYLLWKNVLDLPGPRSSHSTATPRGGGLAIVIITCSAAAWLAYRDLPLEVAAGWLAGGMTIAAIGFVDDHVPLAAGVRLAVQTAAAILALVCLGGVPELPVGDQTLRLGIWGYPLAVLAMVWMLNLYNFMDGIDGLAAAEAVFIFGSAAWLAPGPGSLPFQQFFAIAAGAAFGFLCWNWAPAKIFMGDVGSGFIGFLVAASAVATAAANVLPLWSWLILAGVFVSDASVTLIRRALRGEPLYLAHRCHAYQRLQRRWQSHARVSASVLLVNVLWLLPLAYLAVRMPGYGLLLTIIAWSPLACLALLLGAGLPGEIGSPPELDTARPR